MKYVAEVEDEMSSPFFVFEVPYYVDVAATMAEWDLARRRLKELGVHRPRRFSELDPSRAPEVSRLLNHRAIVEFAQYARFESVIVHPMILWCRFQPEIEEFFTWHMLPLYHQSMPHKPLAG